LNFLFSLYPYAFALLYNQQISRSTTVGTAHTFHMEQKQSSEINYYFFFGMTHKFNWFCWAIESPHIIYIINQLLNLAYLKMESITLSRNYSWMNYFAYNFSNHELHFAALLFYFCIYEVSNYNSSIEVDNIILFLLNN
jgi:hypothetical protein